MNIRKDEIMYTSDIDPSPSEKFLLIETLISPAVQKKAIIRPLSNNRNPNVFQCKFLTWVSAVVS